MLNRSLVYPLCSQYSPKLHSPLSLVVYIKFTHQLRGKEGGTFCYLIVSCYLRQRHFSLSRSACPRACLSHLSRLPPSCLLLYSLSLWGRLVTLPMQQPQYPLQEHSKGDCDPPSIPFRTFVTFMSLVFVQYFLIFTGYLE